MECWQLTQAGLRQGEPGGGDDPPADRGGTQGRGGDQLCGKLLPGGAAYQGPRGHQEGNQPENSRESSYQLSTFFFLLKVDV